MYFWGGVWVCTYLFLPLEGVLVYTMYLSLRYVLRCVGMYLLSPPLHTRRGNPIQHLRCLALAADSLCDGDVIERTIRKDSPLGAPPSPGMPHPPWKFMVCLSHRLQYKSIGLHKS